MSILLNLFLFSLICVFHCTIDILFSDSVYSAIKKNGVKKSQANQKVLYKFLEEAIIGRCDFMSSNHYMVKGCDGIHMNCSSEMDNARKWVSESFRFIQAHL